MTETIEFLEELVDAHRIIMAVAIAEFDAARKQLEAARNDRRAAKAPRGD